MEDDAIREATASDRLTLAEEYENQVSWRTSPDKLTFILCRAGPADRAAAVAGQDDAPERMVGDINLFLTPWDDADVEDETAGAAGGGAATSRGLEYVQAEVDVMIAGAADRGRGLGKAAVRTLLCFVARHAEGLLREYAGGSAAAADETAGASPPALREFVARIQANNAGSLALFTGLGFQKRGGVNYFGEVEMVRPADAEWDTRARDVADYREIGYNRSLLPATAGP